MWGRVNAKLIRVGISDRGRVFSKAAKAGVVVHTRDAEVSES